MKQKVYFNPKLNKLKSSLERLREKLQTARDSEADKIQKFLLNLKMKTTALKKLFLNFV